MGSRSDAYGGQNCGDCGLQFRMHWHHPSLAALALADAQGRTFGIQMQVTGFESPKIPRL